MDKLKPCPFCKEEEDLEIVQENILVEVGFGKKTFREKVAYHIKCYDIEQTKYYDTEEEAIKAWNTRQEDTNHDN